MTDTTTHKMTRAMTRKANSVDAWMRKDKKTGQLYYGKAFATRELARDECFTKDVFPVLVRITEIHPARAKKQEK